MLVLKRHGQQNPSAFPYKASTSDIFDLLKPAREGIVYVHQGCANGAGEKRLLKCSGHHYSPPPLPLHPLPITTGERTIS